jgi:hypothetical protein
LDEQALAFPFFHAVFLKVLPGKGEDGGEEEDKEEGAEGWKTWENSGRGESIHRHGLSIALFRRRQGALS